MSEWHEITRMIREGMQHSTDWRAIFDNLPDRAAVWLRGLPRLWRGYWRAVYHTVGTHLGASPSVLAFIDWALQVVPVHPRTQWVGPTPAELPWRQLYETYVGLAQWPPYMVFLAPLLGGDVTPDLPPTKIWGTVWLWPGSMDDKAATEWSESLTQAGFARSPLRLLWNVIQARPHQFDAAWELSANVWLVNRKPLLVNPQGEPQYPDGLQEDAFRELNMTLTALRLAHPSPWAVPAVLVAQEPFLGQAPVWQWSTSMPAPIPPNWSGSQALRSNDVPGIHHWLRRLECIPWESFPSLPFMRRETVLGVRGGPVLPESYVAGNYLEYALVLWDLTFGRSATETVLNAWSTLECLTAVTETKVVKRRTKALVPRDAEPVVEKLSRLRQAFGHSQLSKAKKHPRTITYRDILDIRRVIRTVMQKVIEYVADHPSVFFQRDGVAQLADANTSQ